MKFKFLIPLLFLAANSLFAQTSGQTKTDSLKVALSAAKEDTVKVVILTMLSDRSCWLGNYDLALAYANLALKLAEKNDFKKGIATAYNNISVVNFFQGDYPISMDHSLTALRIAESIGDKYQMGVAYKNIGLVYTRQNNDEKAIENHIKSVQIMESIGNKNGMGRAYNNIAMIYSKRGEYEKAIENYSKAYDLMKSIGDTRSQYIIQNNIGEMHSRKGEYSTALDKYLTALAVFDSIGDNKGKSITYLNLGLTYIHLGKISEAKEWLHKSLSLNKRLDTKEYIKSSYEGLSKADSITGDFASSLENYKMFITYRDSLTNEENNKKLNHATLQYEFDKKEATAKAEREKKDIQQRHIRNASFATVGGLLLFSLIAVRERNKTKKAQQRAEHSEQIKKEFLANMSHEIRTPMNAIIGMTNLVLDSPLEEKQKKYLNGVKKSSENLLHIINDILDFSKVEAGKMELETIDFSIRELAEQVVAIFKQKAADKGIEIFSTVSADVPEASVGDPMRLNQVLMNLAGNAIKFTEKGSVQIEINSVSNDENSNLLKFSVIDTGIGIPADKINSVFNSFSQAHSSDSRKFGGTGLGLSISKQLVELMGGKILIESEVGLGSKFSFLVSLPKGSVENIRSQTVKNTVDGNCLNGLRILIADDNEDNRIVCRDTLESKSKVEIAEAVNGAEVLEKLIQQDFDIILMDVQMPVMDGLEATKKIRNEFDEPKRRIPIIALTASVIRSDIDKCRAVGMDDYVPKPFSEEELFRTISKLTGKELRFTLKSDSKTGNETVRPNVDLTYLRNFCKNDHLKMKKYIDLFLNRAPKLNTALETELAENNFEEIASQAHGFKVSLMMMGMEDAKQIALKLEADCRLATKDVENIRLNTLELIRRISEAINELKQNISNFTV